MLDCFRRFFRALQSGLTDLAPGGVAGVEAAGWLGGQIPMQMDLLRALAHGWRVGPSDALEAHFFLP